MFAKPTILFALFSLLITLIFREARREINRSIKLHFIIMAAFVQHQPLQSLFVFGLYYCQDFQVCV